MFSNFCLVSTANLTLTDSENKKAELLCESALYAIRGGDILSAVTSLKQTLQMLQKAARSNWTKFKNLHYTLDCLTVDTHLMYI